MTKSVVAILPGNVFELFEVPDECTSLPVRAGEGGASGAILQMSIVEHKFNDRVYLVARHSTLIEDEVIEKAIKKFFK